MSKNKPITIGIDVNEANVKNKVGSNQYAFEIIRALYNTDKFNQYVLYSSRPIRSDMPKARENWQYKVIPPARLWTQWRLPIELYKDRHRLNVFFTPGHYAPRFSPIPTVVTIMDLAYLFYPDFFLKKDTYKLTTWTRYSVKNAQAIITISKNTKKDIVSQYQIPNEKITIAYPGYSHDLKSKSIINHKSLIINRPYILFVGTLQPRKNIVRLIKSFELANLELDLVIAGKQGWLSDSIYEAINNSPAKSKIKLLGFVEDDELPSLYQNSSCVVMPGLYEGFGIPALEAITYNALPVISNTGSLPEVVGDKAILFDPYSVDSISKALKKAVQLPQAEREILIKTYKKHIIQFDWQVSANLILEVLHDVAIS